MNRLTGSLAAIFTVAMPLLAMAAEQAAEHGAHAGAAHEQPGLLSADPGLAIFTLILFVFLVLVLGGFVWPPILKGLQAREEKIRGEIHSAQEANKQARATLADYEKKLAEAHAEARKLVDQARTDAEAVRQKLTGETESQIAQLRQRATQEIGQAKQQAVQELYDKAARLSVAVAEKILERQVTDSDTQALVERSLRELEHVKVN